MKRKIVLIILGFIFVTGMQAQKSVEGVFDKYGDDERFTYVSLGRGAVNMAKSFVNFSDLSNKEQKMIENLTGLKILSLELYSDKDKKLAKSILDDVDKVVKTDRYEVLAEVRDKSERVNIYSSKNGNEMVIITNDGDDLSLIWIK